MRTAEKNRVEKLLEDAQIKLSVVASDIFGVSGRADAGRPVGRRTRPSALAQLARTRMRGKIPLLEEAFVGQFTDHHAFLLRTMLARIDETSADIAAVEARIDRPADHAQPPPFPPVRDWGWSAVSSGSRQSGQRPACLVSRRRL